MRISKRIIQAQIRKNVRELTVEEVSNSPYNQGMFQKANSGWYIFVLLSLTPLIPWALNVPFHYRFADAYSAFTSIGDILGLVGFTMFSLTLVLSVRISFFEDFFGGMNKVYIAHHFFGGLALVLLLFHPISLALSKATISWSSAADFLTPGNDWSVNFGMAGLLFLMALLILTLFVKIPYHIWKWTHKFLGAVFLVAGFHAFTVPSDVSIDPVLKGYMYGILGLGTAAYTYRTLLGWLFVRRYDYIVQNVTEPGDDVTEILLSPKNNAIKVTPGQFIFIGFKSKNVSGESHPFSVSQVLENGQITVSAKKEGDFTDTLPSLQRGDVGRIEGAFGRFSFNRYKNKNQVWVAGGIGITPFLGMAATLVKTDYTVDLYYAVHAEKEAVYLKELSELAKKSKNFRLFPVFTVTQGRLTAEVIQNATPDFLKKDFFICGPPAMMYSLREQLVKLGVQDSHIHTEEFTIYED